MFSGSDVFLSTLQIKIFAFRLLLKLAELLWARNIPLLICRSYGMLGYIRVVVREHPIVESHPENSRPDLRLDRPFPEFTQFCDDCGDLEKMTKKEHCHTPWLVILYKVLQRFKALVSFAYVCVCIHFHVQYLSVKYNFFVVLLVL